MAYYKKLVGRRLYLSPVDPADAETYIRWLNEDRELAVNFSEFPKVIASKDDLKWLFEPPEHMRRFAIVLRDGDRLIGSISLHNLDSINHSAFIGIFIGDEDCRSHGYGAEALRLILEFGFYTMNLHSIMLSLNSANERGLRCYKKAGFRVVGRLPEALFINGRYLDKLYMCILRDEFEVMAES